MALCRNWARRAAWDSPRERGIRDRLGLGAPGETFGVSTGGCQDWHYAGVCRFAQRKTAARFGRARLVLAGTPGRLPAVGRRTRGRHRAHGRGRPQRICLRHEENPAPGVPAAGEGLGSPLRCAWAIAISPKTMMVASRRHSEGEGVSSIEFPKNGQKRLDWRSHGPQSALSQTDASTPARKELRAAIGVSTRNRRSAKGQLWDCLVHGCIRGIALNIGLGKRQEDNLPDFSALPMNLGEVSDPGKNDHIQTEATKTQRGAVNRGRMSTGEAGRRHVPEQLRFCCPITDRGPEGAPASGCRPAVDKERLEAQHPTPQQVLAILNTL